MPDVTILRKYSDDKPLLGASYVLRCQVYSEPMATVTWRKDGSILNDNNKYINHSSYSNVLNVLIIKAFSQHDGGTYTCMAVNSVGTGADEITVSGNLYMY